MIFTGILSFILSLINGMFNAFSWPVVTQLPFGIDPILVGGFGNLYYLINSFPPLGIILSGFIWVLGWKIGLFFLRMFHIVA
jgi:hypothetical protein